MMGLYATPGHYIRSRRIAASMTVEDLALCLETEPPLAMRRRAEWLAAIENDTLPVSPTTAAALRGVQPLAIDDYLLAQLMENQPGDAMTIRFRPAAASAAA